MKFFVVFFPTDEFIKMHGQSYQNRCFCCSLRIGCICIGILQLLLMPIQSVFFINIVPIPVTCLFYTGALVGIIVAVFVIIGAIRRNQFFLWPIIVINGIGVVVIPLIYYFLEIRRTRDALGIAAIWIYTSWLITITAVQILLTFIIYRYISELRDQKNHKHKYDIVSADAKNVSPLPV